MVAVPDFAPYAMENWGLVLCRDVAFLYDPAVSDADDKKLVARVVSHELGHQVSSVDITHTLQMNIQFFCALRHENPELSTMQNV